VVLTRGSAPAVRTAPVDAAKARLRVAS